MPFSRYDPSSGYGHTSNPTTSPSTIPNLPHLTPAPSAMHASYIRSVWPNGKSNH